MYSKLFRHEILSFLRHPSFSANVIMKIFMVIGGLYLASIFLFGGIGAFYYAHEELKTDAFLYFSRWFGFVWFLDLSMRFFIQQMPTQNIKPYLTLNISKTKLVKYLIVKTFLSFFNWSYLLIFIPVFAMGIYFGYPFMQTLAWVCAMYLLLVFNNFINILVHGKKWLPALLTGLLIVVIVLEYYSIFSFSKYFEIVFGAFYRQPWLVLIPVLLVAVTARAAYHLIYNNFYLDSGLAAKNEKITRDDYRFLNRFGKLGLFLQNDIRLLRRNPYPRQILGTGVIFLFYGLLIYFGESYQDAWFKFIAGIIVTGGFMLSYGAYVPSWDSSYYPLMMTQNFSYKDYIHSKWWLMVIGTLASMVLSVFYVLIDFEFWLIILAAGVYNLGINSHLTLLGGAFIKVPIDLNAKRKAFGNKNAWNLRNLLLSIPKMLFPMVVFIIVNYLYNSTVAIFTIVIIGLFGFLFRNAVLNQTIKIYKKEKYAALHAYKQDS